MVGGLLGLAGLEKRENLLSGTQVPRVDRAGLGLRLGLMVGW